MRALPRLIAGTAVAIAAVLTAAPLGAGIADLVLSPGHQGKRAVAPVASAESAGQPQGEPWGGGPQHDRAEETPVVNAAEVVTLPPRTVDSTTTEAQAPIFSTPSGAGAESAEARIAELAADLQAGVAAGEFSQADADRVLSDMSGYIRGERTWPERAEV